MKGAADRFDVAVIGGGSAGLAAAVTAARTGARTLLIERHGFLGGMGTASLVHTFCGLYLLREEPDAVLANPGFPSEIAGLMIAATGLGPRRMGRVDVLPQHPVEFARIADDLVLAEASLETRLHTEVTGISDREDAWEIRTSGRSGARLIRARAMVDASGDAMAADLLGRASKQVEAPRLQRPAYAFGVQGLPGFSDDAKLATAGLIVDGIREGAVPAGAMGMTFRTSGRPGEVFGTIDLAGAENPADYDPLDAACLTGLEMQGRKIASDTVRWLSARSPVWRGGFISCWPVRAGVRESRRWIGGHVLTGEEISRGQRFNDEIGLATWPMEFRETAKGPKLRFPENNRPCGIPLRCLKPYGIERLFVAGRCISADHDAQASIRVMGTCFVTGEAAGREAARS